MKRVFFLLALVGAVLLSAGPVLADGDFYVVVAGGGVGTKITSLPYTVTAPGFYYLTGNLTYSGTSNGITVSSDDVTIDLMGFCLSGPGSDSSATGILVCNKNVEVRNGSLNGWSRCLINADVGSSLRMRAINLRVRNFSLGIILSGGGGGILVKGCSAEAGATGININGGVATGNTVINCGCGIMGFGTISGNCVLNCSYGIWCNDGEVSLIGNMVGTNSGQHGIYISTSAPILVTQNTVGGSGTHFTPGTGTVNVANTNAGF